MAVEYEELRIRVWPVGQGRFLVLASGPASAAEIVECPDAHRFARERNLLLDEDLNLREPPERAEPVAVRLLALGRELFCWLFPQRIVDCVETSLRQAHRLRLRFVLDGSLSDLPIEILSAPADLHWGALARYPKLTLVHSLRGAPPGGLRLPLPGEKARRLRLIVVVASPGSRPVDVGPCIRELLQHPLVDAEVLSRLDLGQPLLQPATLDGVAAFVRRRPDQPCALMLIAHGEFSTVRNTGLVLLETQDGGVAAVDGVTLANALAGCEALRLAILGNCTGAETVQGEPFSGVAQSLIAAGIPVAIAMRTPVAEAAADEFARELIVALCDNTPVDEAVRHARHKTSEVEALSVDEEKVPVHIQWCIPTCLINEEIRSTWLFKIVRIGGPRLANPQLEGEKALREFNSDNWRSAKRVLVAARHLRNLRRWAEVSRASRAVLMFTACEDRDRDEARALLEEASIETHAAHLREACLRLAEEHGGGGARLALRKAAEIPPAMRELLHQEAEQADEVWSLYSQVPSRDDQGPVDWDGVAGQCAALLRLRPRGYRDTTRLHLYALGRGKERLARWDEALELYQATGASSTAGAYRDAAARAAYVRGRAAIERRNWDDAEASFGDLPLGWGDEAGRPRGGWLQYTAGRRYQALCQWDDAQKQFADLPEGFHDTRKHWAYCRGREAEERQPPDWGWAASAYAEIRDCLDLFPDIADRVAYCQGRQLSEPEELPERDWAQVAGLFKRVANTALYPDAPLQEAYSRLRRHELAEAWDLVVKQQEVLLEFRDAPIRGKFARARLATSQGEFQAALRALRDLIGSDQSVYSKRDLGDRIQYCQGMEAFEAARLAQPGDQPGSWEHAAASFGDLANEFDDVKSYRYYARARGHQARGRWAEAREDFSQVAPDFRDVAVRRGYCRGRSAEATGNWAEASEAYSSLATADALATFPDVPRRVAYCQGHLAWQADDWGTVADRFETAGAVEPDALLRASYGRGRLAEAGPSEEGGTWDRALHCYEPLPGDFADAGQRAVYCRAHRHRLSGQWKEAESEFGRLPPDYRNAGNWMDYARARQAEAASDWVQAADLTLALPQDLAPDLAFLRSYACARVGEDDGAWGEAIGLYQALAAVERDVGNRLERLTALRKEIPWLDGLARAGMVADPLGAGVAASPYAGLTAVGIRPSSAQDEVVAAGQVLFERGLMTSEAGLAWNLIKEITGRLRADAWLYPLHDPQAIRHAERDLRPASAAELLDRLCQQCPDDASLLLLLGGQREAALRRWQAQQVADPAQRSVAHAAALASFWRARDLEARGAYERADVAWDDAIGEWALLLTSHGYWIDWARERSGSYGMAITEAELQSLLLGLQQSLEEALNSLANEHAEQGNRQRAAQCRSQVLSLQEELQAARVLSECGGLPVADRAEPVCLGPRLLHRLGLEPALARLVQRLDRPLAESPDDWGPDPFVALESALGNRAHASPPKSIHPDTAHRLRCLFSRLARATTLALRDMPSEALLAVPAEVFAWQIGQVPGDEVSASDEPAGRNPERQDRPFVPADTAYRCFPDWRIRWLQDGVRLVVDIQLGQVGEALAGDAPNLAEALRIADAAIRLADRVGSQVRTKQAVASLVVERAKALARGEGRDRGIKLTRAIELVGQARGLLGAVERERLAQQLAELLTERGVWYGNGCGDYADPDYPSATADLKAALALVPALPYALDNLARASLYHSREMRQAGWKPKAWEQTAEAFRALRKGLRLVPRPEVLLPIFRQALDELETLILGELSEETALQRHEQALGEARPSQAELIAEGHARLSEQDTVRALLSFLDAARLNPAVEAARAALFVAVEQHVGLPPAPEVTP